jgi:hypothetical protein
MSEIYFAPGGTGDGLSPASPTGSRRVLRELLQTERGKPIEGTPERIPWTTVTPGIDTDYDADGPDGGLLSYVPQPVECVRRTRVNWATDRGTYNTGDSDPWLVLGPEHGGVGRAGTLADPHQIVQHVGWRSADNVRSTDVAGGVETRSAVIASKDPKVDWNSTTYYDSGGRWVGPVVQKTYTWTAQLPSPVRAVIVGNRTKDPRTDRKRQIWNGGDNATRQMRPGNPYARRKNAVILNPDGTELIMIRGDVYDIDAKTKVNHGWSRLGNIVIKTRAPYTVFQGFEFRDCAGPFSFGGTDEVMRFAGFRDIKTDNTRYGIQRGHTVRDVLNERWHSTACAQKLWSIGRNCLRWWFQHITWDGAYVIGDGTVQAGIVAASDSSEGSGIVAIRNLIGESLISGVPVGTNRYVQGDDLDMELLGFSLKHAWGRNLLDGLVDAKSGSYYGNMGITICDVYGEDVKRLLRSWAPAAGIAEGRILSAPWEVRDVTGENSTDTNLITFNSLLSTPPPDSMVPFDKFVRWDNPSGRAFAQGSLANGSMQHNDGKLFAPQRVVQARFFDARPAGSTDSGEIKKTSSDGQYTYKLERPVAKPVPVGVKVNGVAVQPGHRMLVQPGEVVTVQPGRPLAAGETVRYRVIGEATTSVRSGVLTLTAQTQVA